MKILLALKANQEKLNKYVNKLLECAQKDDVELTYDVVVSEVAIRNKMNEKHYDAVITMSRLEAKPFTIEALTSISEIDEDTKLIIIMSDKAKGSEYCERLLRNNLLYGVFLGDDKASDIYKLIKTKSP